MSVELRRAVDRDKNFGNRGGRARVMKWTASELRRREGEKKLVAGENKLQGGRLYML